MTAMKNFLTRGLVCIAYLPVFACATNGFDDDAINQRGVYRDDDTRGLLPTPQQANEEARQYRRDDDKTIDNGRKGDDAITADDGDGTFNDLNAAYARILVPEAQAEQPYFAPVKKGGKNSIEAAMNSTLKAGGTTRRRPVFLGKIGVEAMLNQMTGVNVNAPASVTGGIMSFSARAGRGAGQIANRESMGTYIVRPGDTLSTISVHIYGTSGRWMELAHMNRLGNGSIIFPNEVILFIPDKSAAAP